MFARIQNGIQLTRQSLSVLRSDKTLLVFPFLSGIALTAVLATFALPLWLTGFAEQASRDPQQLKQDPIAYVVLFAFYFVNYFVIVFFNSALISCALVRLQGGSPTLGDGLRAATARLPQIAGWALVSASVGILLKAIESRSQRVGQLVASLMGGAWSIATYFVVPVLVVERVGPFTALRRSLSILRKTWGESLTAQFGIGLVVMGAVLVALSPALVGFAVGSALDSAAPIVIGIGLTVLCVIVVSLVSAALHSIILAALYLYAAQGKLPEQFDNELLQNAYGAK